MSTTFFGLSTSYLFAVTYALTPAPGEPSTGACCFEDGCLELTEEHCAAEGGDYQGDGSHCPNDACVGTPTGACCIGDGCHVLTEEHCAAEGGAYQGDGSKCEPKTCGGNAGGIGGEAGCEGCTADLDKDGAVGASDLSILLGGWGPNPNHAADFNNDGVVDADDLAAMLGAWGPCS